MNFEAAFAQRAEGTSPDGAAAGRALVVGGSLAGLSAANWLRVLGWEVEVYERAQRPLQDQGAGLVLHPSTSRFLTEHEGLALDDFSVSVASLRYIGSDGAVVSEAPCRLRFASYGSIYGALRQALARRGGLYRHGATVTGVGRDTGGPAVITLADSTQAEADLVVGADGIGSTLRRLILPAVAPVAAGYVAWRGVIAETQLPRPTRDALSGAITYTILERSHILTYPIRTRPSGTVLRNWVWYRNLSSSAELEDLLRDRTGARRDLSVPAGSVRADVVEVLGDDARRQLPPPVAVVVTGTPEPFMQVVVDVSPPRMSFGNVCLLGDAGFVARPHAAAGTAKAAEEAWLLARVLAENGSDPRASLSRWESLVVPMGQRLVARSRRAGERAQFDDTWEVGEPLPFGLHEAGDSEYP